MDACEPIQEMGGKLIKVNTWPGDPNFIETSMESKLRRKVTSDKWQVNSYSTERVWVVMSDYMHFRQSTIDYV